MALGDFRNNNSTGNKSNKLYESTYYSRLSFKNSEGLRLGFSFKSGMLIAEIAKETDGFQYESLVSCYITPTKAKILLNEINEFEDAVANKKYKAGAGYGINAGMGEVSTVFIIHQFDNIPAITIGKVDGSGKYLQKFTFKFNTNYHYGIRFADYESMSTCEKEFFDGTELEQLKDIIASFAYNMNGVIAYSTVDLARYDYKGIMNKMNPIYEKLGIEISANRSSNSDNNFFSGNNGGFNKGKSNSTSIDNVMDGLPFDED